MMSTGVLMAAVAEPAGARLVSGDLLADRNKLGGAPFAESLSERLGESALLQKNGSAGEATTEARDFKRTMSWRKSDQVNEVRDGLNGNAIAPLNISANGELKTVAADKIVQPQVVAFTGVPEKSAAIDTGMKNVEPLAETKEATSDVSPNSIPLHAPAVLMNERLMSHVDVANEGWPSVSSSNGTVVRKKIETGEKMKTGISAKGAAKAQGSAAPNIVGPGLAVISRSFVSPSMDGAIPGVVPVVQAVVTGVTVPRSAAARR
jgi:hypothetical protein